MISTVLIVLVTLLATAAVLAIAGAVALPLLKRRLKGALAYQSEALLLREGQNIGRARQRLALEDTARFVEENFHDAKPFTTKEQVLDFALSKTQPTPNGLYCEFGVFEGHTINHIASRAQATIHGFDSFEGLPEHWRDEHEASTFKVERLPTVAKNVELHKGWFNETLPPFLTIHAGPVTFLHVDCDLYSSTRTVFESLTRRIVAGTVIVFDEYFNYAGWREGEHKAFEEFVATSGARFVYLAYNRLSEQVAVQITSIE